jgi:hypothetical protein
MSLQILDATTRTAVAAATSQQAKCEALIAPWAGGNVTARLFAPDGTTLLRTLTLPPLTINSATPRSVVCGAYIADTHIATGTPGRWVFRSGSTDIFSIDAGTSGASVNHLGAVKALCTPTIAGVLFTADASLPLTGLPSWLAGAALFDAHPVPNSNVGIPNNVLSAWGCLVPIPGTNKLVSPANGGHNDSADNGVYELDLSLNTQVGFVTKIAPSASIAALVAYQTDGKTHSRHGYKHAHFIPQRQIILLAGSRGWYNNGAGTGDGQVDAVNVSSSTYTWSAAGDYPKIGGTLDARGFGIACDPLTGNVWTSAGWLWTQSTNTWDNPGTYTGILRWNWEWDSLRERWAGFHWSDGQGYGPAALAAQILNRTTGVATNISWASDAETVASLAEIASVNPQATSTDGALNYEGCCYDSDRDVFYLFFGHQSDTTLARRMYEIGPQSGASGWTMTRRTITNMPFTQQTGILGLWRYMPLLKGIYAHPKQAVGGGVFIRTSE